VRIVLKIRLAVSTRGPRSRSTCCADLAAVAGEVRDYHEDPTDQKKGRLEGIARTYGGNVHKFVWSVIKPAE
jgi:hypothetical protein